MVWEEFVKIFTEMSWMVGVLLILGIVLCIIEGVVPGFGFFGITGIISEIAAVVIHAIVTSSPWQVFFLVLIVAVVFVVIVLIFVISAKHGLLAKTPLFENKPSVPYNYGVDKNFVKLIGKKGVVVEKCHPIGKIKIEGRIMEALSTQEVIEKGSTIRIVKIKDNTLYIEKFEGDKK